MNKLGVDFQQGGCLYKPTSGITWTPEYLWMSDRAQKQASEKADRSIFDSGDVVIGQFINGTMYISWQLKHFYHFVDGYVAGFGKSRHI